MSHLLTFFGPEHHLHLLSPVMQAARQHGARATWYTANADASFEHGGVSLLNEPFFNLPTCLADNDERPHTLYRSFKRHVQDLYMGGHPAVSLVVPDAMDRALYEISRDHYALQRLIEDQRPTATLALHELHRWGRSLGYWSAVKKIPFFTLQEGMYYGPLQLYASHCQQSVSLVWGEATKDILVAAGNDPGRIEVIGHPHIAERWKDAEHCTFEASDSLPADFHERTLILVYLTAQELAHHLKWEELAASCGESRIIVHLAATEDRPRMLKLADRLAPLHNIYLERNPRLLWPHAHLSSAVVVVGCSTFSLECLWRGKPLAELPLPGQFFSFSQNGLAYDASNNANVSEWMLRAQEFHSHERTRNCVADFIGRHFAHANAAEIIAKRILS